MGKGIPTELEGGEGRRIKAEPEILALAEGGEDGLAEEGRLEVGAGDALDDLEVVCD